MWHLLVTLTTVLLNYVPLPDSSEEEDASATPSPANTAPESSDEDWEPEHGEPDLTSHLLEPTGSERLLYNSVAAGPPGIAAAGVEYLQYGYIRLFDVPPPQVPLLRHHLQQLDTVLAVINLHVPLHCRLLYQLATNATEFSALRWAFRITPDWPGSPIAMPLNTAIISRFVPTAGLPNLFEATSCFLHRASHQFWEDVTTDGPDIAVIDAWDAPRRNRFYFWHIRDWQSQLLHLSNFHFTAPWGCNIGWNGPLGMPN